MTMPCLTQSPPPEVTKGIPTEATTAAEVLSEHETSPTLEESLSKIFGKVNSVLVSTLFGDISFGAFQKPQLDDKNKPILDDDGKPKVEGPTVPFVVALLAFGATFYTLFYGWINVRGFRHAINVVRGKFDKPHDEGEITHFRALTSALSATVGLGNIAGVAIAVKTGGPGAIFWMLLLAVFGMTAKFHECTLAQMFRRQNPDGTISGGPMFYLHAGLKKVHGGLGPIGKLLAILFAFMCMGGALGGGNMFQANQSWEAFRTAFEIPADNLWAARGYGIVMAGLVGAVILGGIQRIGSATSRIVPAMCGLYVIASLIIILTNFNQIPAALMTIITSAIHPEAAFGGFIGVMITGFKRAAFSNEAGLGSAAIAHAAAKTDEPVREGIVAMLGPFIDTIVICLMTALVVIITSAHTEAPEGANGAAITMYAFHALPSVLGHVFPFILSICIVLFAYSTMISWCYYGERAWISLFGQRTLLIFRLVFVVFVFLGSIMVLDDVLLFSDLMILCMAFPNILGGIFLAPMVKRELNNYWQRYTRGQMVPTAQKTKSDDQYEI